jgi:T5SS/PEP-CTERM-associated repeat protein
VCGQNIVIVIVTFFVGGCIMRTRIVLCAGIVLCLAGALGAQSTTTWVEANSGKWSDASNWAGETLPSPAIKAFFNGSSECIVDIADAGAWQIDLGGGPLKIVEGGNLTVTDWFILGYNEGDLDDSAGRVEVYDGGVLNSRVRLYVGYRGEGYLTIYEGGTVNVHTQLLGVGRQPGGKGAVILEGGSLNLLAGTDANSLDVYTSEASVDFRGGVMTLQDTTANRENFSNAIRDGIIKAYGGVGEVVVDPNETPGWLVVRGVHPLKPLPSDDGVSSAGEVELSWTLPEPNVPGQPVPVDVYFTDDLQALQLFYDPAAIQVVNKQNVTSVVVQTQPKTRYYWAVDAYVDSDAAFPVVGPIFSFLADNMPPKVNAGADVVTWLEGGSRSGNLDATVTDDGAISPFTVQWTVVSEPDEGAAVIETATAEDTNITLTALGEYVFQLEAFDGEYSGSDTVTINVFSDSCQAAQSLPDYVPLVGDLNGDCRVDEADLALLEENWLQDNSLTEEWFQVE